MVSFNRELLWEFILSWMLSFPPFLYLYLYIDYRHICIMHTDNNYLMCRSLWPYGLRSRSAAARLLGFWVRIQPGAWMFVCCDCRVLSSRSPCDGLIIRPEESYQLWCVLECDLETLWMSRPWPTWGCWAK